MRLIDADAVIKDFYSNFGDVHDAISAQKIIDRQPTVDPIRAAGGCRCGECKYLETVEGGQDYCDLRQSVCTKFCGDGVPGEAKDDD